MASTTPRRRAGWATWSIDDGLVDGFANVHAVDASVFPDLPRANTYVPTLLLAERLAARLIGR